jgi:hypothetical protein
MVWMARLQFLARARFFFFETNSEAHPASYAMGSWENFLEDELKRPGCKADHLPPSIAKERTKVLKRCLNSVMYLRGIVPN